MLACKFQFIFHFYLPFKSCSFNYGDLLLSINNSVGIRRCNHQLSSHINGVCKKWWLIRFPSLALTRLSFPTLHYLNQYDFSTNQYIHNTQIKHLHGTYIWKVYKKHVKNIPDKQIELKNYWKNAEPNWFHSCNIARIVQSKAKKLIYFKCG